MPTVDTLNNQLSNQSLYFQATAAASQQEARLAAKKKKEIEKPRLNSFTSIFKKAQEENQLEAEGLPAEIAGMTPEDAIVYLKDNVDSMGDLLKNSKTPATFSKYRTAVSQFMRYVEKNNFQVIKIQRRGFNRKTKRRLDPRIQVKVINTKLDQLASDMLYNHMENLKLLARVEEINGMLIDLIAI
ncbi:MAG: YaaR family protein [Treponema sp.]|nr:YaaR family protein [Treponema sp.]